MNNILSYKSELVSNVIDAIFNAELSFSAITQLSNVTKEYDFFSEVEKTVEKVVGDYIIKNFRFIKEGRISHSLDGLVNNAMNILWDKHSL